MLRISAEYDLVVIGSEPAGRRGDPLRGGNLPVQGARRGQIIGDRHGFLKLLVGTDDRRVLGVHVFGTGATEVVHIGQVVMSNEGTADTLVDTVFNYPTLAESYKVAALDVTNKLHALSRLGV